MFVLSTRRLTRTTGVPNTDIAIETFILLCTPAPVVSFTTSLFSSVCQLSTVVVCVVDFRFIFPQAFETMASTCLSTCAWPVFFARLVAQGTSSPPKRPPRGIQHHQERPEPLRAVKAEAYDSIHFRVRVWWRRRESSSRGRGGG